MKSGFVALVGRPNAGKSTLLNALVGTKLAIVSDKPQTTRTRILGVKTTPTAQMVFVDTPGIHRPLHRMNVRMVDTALDALRSLDVVVLVVDASEATGKGDRLHARACSRTSGSRSSWPQQDRPGRQADAAAADGVVPGALRSSPTSSRSRPRPATASPRSKRSSPSTCRRASRRFPEDYLTDQPERRIAAELVREQVLAVTEDELPFSTAVVIDQFEEVATGRPTGRPKAGEEIAEPERDLLRIACSILVDRESQKPIVIGKGGEMIKRIGTAARLEIEKFFGTRVFLDLVVKVAPEWRENERVLDDLGIAGTPAQGDGTPGATLRRREDGNSPRRPGVDIQYRCQTGRSLAGRPRAVTPSIPALTPCRCTPPTR